MARRLGAVAGLLAGLAAAPAGATPSVPADDPVLVELARLHDAGSLPGWLVGLGPLSEARVQALLRAGGAPPEPRLLDVDIDGPWVRPLGQARLALAWVSEEARPYSLPLHPQDMEGVVAASCEHEQGRPCGDGARATLELDAAAGIGAWLSVSARVRLGAGQDPYGTEATIDRAALQLALGPVDIAVGRDVLALGPGARTALMWGDHPPPVDHLRVMTGQPLDLIGEDGRILRGGALYVLGRLGAPQRFPGTWITGGRLELLLFDVVELGATQLFELGGDGAPTYDLGDFLLEYLSRKPPTPEAGVGISNRRLSFDVSVVAPALGARAYYAVAYEDMRDQVLDAFLYDADHLLGLELALRGPGAARGLVVEYLHTGFRSQTHPLFTSGFTSGGRVLGAPLGPDAWSLYLEGRLAWPWLTLRPSAELARLSSDSWVQDEVGIRRVAEGPTETRVRVALQASLPVASARLELRGFLEHVETFAFAPGRGVDNLGVTIAVVWAPAVGVVRGQRVRDVCGAAFQGAR